MGNRVLNDQNREQVQSVITQAMTNRRLIEISQEALKQLRSGVEWHEANLRECERERDRYDREIKALGFHDIGHARTEMGNG